MHNLKQLLINFDWSLKSIIKAAIGLVVIVIALAIVVGIVGTVAKTVFDFDDDYYGARSSGFALVDEFAETLGFDGEMHAKGMLSARSASVSHDMAFAEPAFLPPAFEEGGDDAEDYERRNYNASYETRKFEETCTAISDLKPLEYVVFDNSNKGEDWCQYTFRAEVEHEDEIIEKLQALNPQDFNISTHTIERSIEYSDSELAMQQRRLESTQKTLDQAEVAFNNLITQATRNGDTATLSQVINNKISTIDRLTQQLLNTQERIDRLSKGRGEQIEQIEYAHFSVSVSKVTLFDGEYMAQQWRDTVRELFNEVNVTLLALTVGLLTFLLQALVFVVFVALSIIGLVFVVRMLWVIVKRIWSWKKQTPTVDRF